MKQLTHQTHPARKMNFMGLASFSRWMAPVLCAFIAMAATIDALAIGSGQDSSSATLSAKGMARILSLGDAVDASSFFWTEGGSANWFHQTAVTHDGNDAAQSGAIGHGQISWFETELEGPGTLSFWWRVSSEPGYDFQVFRLDGELINSRSGEGDWEHWTFSIPIGTHLATWQYVKNGSGSGGSDAAWVDQVVWTPSSGRSIVPHFADRQYLNFAANSSYYWAMIWDYTHGWRESSTPGAVSDNRTLDYSMTDYLEVHVGYLYDWAAGRYVEAQALRNVRL